MAQTQAQPKSVFLFCGEDTYTSTQKLHFWQEEFFKKYGEENSNVEVINGESLDPVEFSTNIETLPFLTEKRLIIIKDFLKNGSDENQKFVAESLERAADFCIVVFFENSPPDRRTTLFQKIKKIGKIEEFPSLLPEDVTKWILEKARNENIKVGHEVASYLSSFCGQNLWTISHELEKLKLFSSDKEITKDMIDTLCTPSLTSSIFKLTDSVAARNAKESLKILKILVESGEEIGKIFFMIVRHFRILIQVKDMILKGERNPSIIKKLKLHPYVVDISSNQAKNFDIKKLEKIYEHLLKIDIGVKTGQIKSFQGDNKEFDLAIEKFIINCCQ